MPFSWKSLLIVLGVSMLFKLARSEKLATERPAPTPSTAAWKRQIDLAAERRQMGVASARGAARSSSPRSSVHAFGVLSNEANSASPAEPLDQITFTTVPVSEGVYDVTEQPVLRDGVWRFSGDGKTHRVVTDRARQYSR